MEYEVNIRKNKSLAKCRICRKQIAAGTLSVFCNGNDGYNNFQLIGHTSCFLSFIIRKVKELQLSTLKEEYDKFSKIEKILNNKIAIKKKVKHNG